MKPVIVFGRNGQVAREIALLCQAFERPAQFLGRAEFDLLTERSVGLILDKAGAGAVINAAAYTAVDRAEAEPDVAFRLNQDAPGSMARACADRRIPFVHISTDYVFDGLKEAPYLETDHKNPKNTYGMSKAAGEDAVVTSGGSYTILRTAWLFSHFGNNFLKTMLRLGQTKSEIGVVDDQMGRPTWARDVARAAIDSIDAMDKSHSALGVLHAAGNEDASWADFASMIFAENARRGHPCPTVRRIGTVDYPTPARRPLNSRLDSSRAQSALGWRATPLPQAIEAVLDQLERT